MKSGTFERNLKTFVLTSPTVLLNTYPQINWHVPQQSNRHRAVGMSKNLERSSNMVGVICPLVSNRVNVTVKISGGGAGGNCRPNSDGPVLVEPRFG